MVRAAPRLREASARRHCWSNLGESEQLDDGDGDEDSENDDDDDNDEVGDDNDDDR